MDQNGKPITRFNGILTLSIHYPDDDQNGVVDGTNIKETSLRMGRFTQGGWKILPTSRVDSSSNRVTALTDHLSTYGLIVRDIDVDDVINFPNPFNMTRYDYIKHLPHCRMTQILR